MVKTPDLDDAAPLSNVDFDEPADVVAAGAVLWCPASDAAEAGDGSSGVRVALVHRPKYDDWSLPKGKLDASESIPVAATREVYEETGVRPLLGARLGHSRYPVEQGEKVVYYWAAKAGDLDGFTPNAEVDELRWLDPSVAERELSYERDREVLRRFRELGPPPTPVLVVRHAKAGSRDSWEGEDDLRPLTEAGRRQAHQLTELLRLFGPARAYAAPPIRCPQTIQPLADELGLTIVEEPLLSEQTYLSDPDAGLTRVLELASGPDVPVLCSQGGVIPDLIARLTGNQQPRARKASTWVLGFTNNQVVTADYYPPPSTRSSRD